MALTATTIFEVEADAGASDTLNSGGFDTASTGKLTNLTTDANTGNTASPIVSSASYNFVAADVGSWVHIQAGTNSVPGWYKVVSVGSNKATLNAAVGAAVLANFTLNTAVGLATVGTPTNLTFAVDYSQVPAVVFSLTGLTTAAANAIILTASATKAMVGNLIQITGGTNFTTGFYVIQACTAGVSLTVDRNCTTAAGVGGTAGIGGALASPGQAGALMVAGNRTWLKSGTFTVTSASTNIAAGCVLLPAGSSATLLTHLMGYGTLRGDSGTKPIIIADGVITTFTLVSTTNSGTWVENLTLDGNSRTSSRGYNNSGNGGNVFNCLGKNFTNSAFNGTGGGIVCEYCEASGCSTAAAILNMTTYRCYVHNNTFTGISTTTQPVQVLWNIVANNSGSTSDGISVGSDSLVLNNTSYGNGRDGFRYINSNSRAQIFANNLAVNNGISSGAGWGFTATSVVAEGVVLRNNATFGNQSGGVNTTQITYPASGNVTLTSDPFINAAGGNFQLNNTAGGGASCRAAAIPGAFPGLAATIGYPDIGAVQHQDSFVVAQQKIVASIGTY